MADLQEVVVWWQERKVSLHQASNSSRETRRVTFFVEKRWEDAIRRQSDLDGLTYTQIVNEAFRHYFESGSLRMSCTHDHGLPCDSMRLNDCTHPFVGRHVPCRKARHAGHHRDDAPPARWRPHSSAWLA